MNSIFSCVKCTQARRHIFKSGPAEYRALAEGTSGGEYERGMAPLVRGIRGISLEKILIMGASECVFYAFWMCLGPEFKFSRFS